MKRRFLIEVEPNGEWPDSMLEILTRVVCSLEQMVTEKLAVDYAIGLESDVTWFVKLAAKAVGELPEPEPIKVLKDPARSYKRIPEGEPDQK